MTDAYSGLTTAVLVALDLDTAKQFFGHRDDESRLAFTKQLAEQDSLNISQSWRAIHACLSDGSLDPNAAEPPLGFCILGGRQMQSSEGAIVSLLRPDMVPAVSGALKALDAGFISDRHATLDESLQTSTAVGNLQESFDDIRAFYQAAETERAAVVFAAW